MTLDRELCSLAESFFDLTLPTSSVEMKKAYRRQCMRLHPDTLHGDEASFKEMQAAYDKLMGADCVLEVISDTEYRETLCTQDGAPLSELGLGLGPTVNGADCPECEHKGYVVQIGEKHIRCDPCNGTGMRPIDVSCKACGGTGKFKQARSKRIVDCRSCKGTGVFRRRRDPRKSATVSFYCSVCRGLGYTREADPDKKTYFRCFRCEGTGELPMWNPVLPKSILGG